MTLPLLDGLWWLLAFLLPFMLIQRWLHREVQAVFLLITRRPAVALGLFSLLFFPGVLLHEASHFFTARLLRVPTGRFSIIPQLLPDGHLRLGYVETASADPIRDALIGTAPLITGGLLIAYLGAFQLKMVPLASLVLNGQWQPLWVSFLALPDQQDFWMWFYLAFTVSSTMLPSSSDRRAWQPVVIGTVLLLGLALLLGAGPWMLENLAPWVERLLRGLAMVFAVSLLLHIVLVLPLWVFRMLLSRLTGLRVV